MWYTWGQACWTMLHGGLTFYGCVGFSNMAARQLGGKIAVLTRSPFHPWRIKIHLVLLIPKMCYDVATSFLASAGEGFIPIWSHCLGVPMTPEIGVVML